MWILCLLLLPALVASQSLVMIGGVLNDTNAAVYNKIVELAGGQGAKIGVISLGSTFPIIEGLSTVDVLNRVYSANASYIHVSTLFPSSNSQIVANQVVQLTGIVLLGSNRQRITNILRPLGNDSLLWTAILQVVKNGGVLAANDGAMASLSSNVMIVRGSTYDGFVNGVVPAGALNLPPLKVSYDAQGLGLINGYVLDSRFSELGREGRLTKVLQETRNSATGTTKGIGIDENTALVVSNVFTQPVGKVIGTTGAVFLFDVANMVSNPSGSTSYSNLSINCINVDDTIDLTTGAISFADWKTDIAGAEWFDHATPTEDIFSNVTPRQWHQTARFLIDSKDKVVYGNSTSKNPPFQVRFDRNSAVGYGADLPDGSYYVASYTNILVDIYPL